MSIKKLVIFESAAISKLSSGQSVGCFGLQSETLNPELGLYLPMKTGKIGDFVRTSYSMLGLVHNMWTSVAGCERKVSVLTNLLHALTRAESSSPALPSIWGYATLFLVELRLSYRKSGGQRGTLSNNLPKGPSQRPVPALRFG